MRAKAVHCCCATSCMVASMALCALLAADKACACASSLRDSASSSSSPERSALLSTLHVRRGQLRPHWTAPKGEFWMSQVDEA